MDPQKENTQSTPPTSTPPTEAAQTPNETHDTPPAPVSDHPTDMPPTPPQATNEEKRVSLRTVLLIIVLAILAGVLLFVALKPAKKVMVQNAGPTPTAKPSQAHSTLSLVMADTSATPSRANVSTKSVNVVLNTESNKVSGVQFEIAYDPTVLTNVTVKSGDFFTKPIVLLNQVDTKNGKINYAIGIQPTADQVNGSGTVAVISFTPLPTASASSTTLKFLPKTQVVQQGIVGSVLQTSYDLNIPIAGLTPSATSPTGHSGLPTAK